ncbi:site-specific integrase [Thaumasiovibrio subtropicus]|uniref:site-specific integrase n=1 Tax=Thaumasiovibrio subtropicus TaxID=1891207 RepID=UPI000B355CB0|nr:site-specific integrase [Thaumasiovibrio subtropicus]
MRYLTLNNSGIWSFRFQIPSKYRSLFDNRSEIKRSLRTSCRSNAKLLALQLELEIRRKIADVSTTHAELAEKTPSLETKRKHPHRYCPMQCLELYRKYKSSYVSAKTIEGATAKCRVVLEIVNKKKLASIRRNDAESARQILASLPSNIKKHQEFVGLTTSEAIKLNNKLGLPVISQSSVKDYIQKTSSFFEWCVQMEFTDINPFKGFKFKLEHKVSKQKNAYSPEQLSSIFSNEIFTKKVYKHNYQYWLPILARLTGARINELCQLRKEDITIVNGTYCIHINRNTPDKRLKTPNAERVIPIHSKLLTLGFIEFTQTVDNDRIFSELKLERDGYATSASKWFGRFKTKLGFEKGHDFHSFRHTPDFR